MDVNEVLTIFDSVERQRPEPGAGAFERTPYLVRCVGAAGGPSWIEWSDLRLAGAPVDEVIAGEIARFGSEGRSFEWKWYDHDRPEEVPQRLQAHGFAAGEHEGLRVLDVTDANATRLAKVDALPGPFRTIVGGLDLFEAACAVLHEVWPSDAPTWTDDLRRRLTAQGDRFRIVVAFAAPVDAPVPVAVGMVRLPKPRSPFAYAFAGAVRSAWRGQGAYRQVVHARAQAVAQAGGRYLVVDTNSMSDPVLQRMGFTSLGGSTPWVWTPG